MNKLMIKLTQRMIKRYLPETIDLQQILDSQAYLQAIGFVEQAEKTKSFGMHKRDFVHAHLMAWYQQKSIQKPKIYVINLIIELAVWRKNKWI